VKESEKRYRFLAESIPQMVWTARPNGLLDYVSGQVAAYFDSPAESLLGAGWFARVHPEDQERVTNRWQYSLHTGHPYEAEFRLRRGSDGEWRWFLVRAHSRPAPDNKVIAWVGTCTDIHDQKESETALRRVNRELEEFTYVASHDLQEPLRMVNIYTQMMLQQAGNSPEMGQYAGFVTKGVNRMEALLRDLLTFSRTVHHDDEATAASLSAALQEAMSVLKNRIEESGAQITAEPLPIVRGDTMQYAHVFQNLLSNAMKYRRPDEPPRISIHAARKGDLCVVTVRDNGVGFEQKYAERVFGLFKRLHTDEYPGTGLGLAICKRIVEQYGGRIWAESAPGQGAAFHFELQNAPTEQPNQ
jgi:PAS domain S-box-containing protein